MRDIRVATATRRSCPRRPAGAGCGRGGPSCTSRWRVPRGGSRRPGGCGSGS